MTMAEVCRDGGLTDEHRQYIAELDAPAQHCFNYQFAKEYSSTRSEVSRRVTGMLSNTVLQHMLLSQSSRFKMHDEMGTPGRIICINTAKSLLGQTGHKLFGRLFIAMVLQSVQERALATNRPPTFLYIDEAYEYLDENVKTLLVTARKYRVGVIIAHQYLGQLSSDLNSAVVGATAVKIMGVVSDEDVGVAARTFNTSRDEVMAIKRHHFLARFPGFWKLPWQALPIDEKKFPPASSEELAAFRATMREQYCHHYAGKPALPDAEKDVPPTGGDDLY